MEEMLETAAAAETPTREEYEARIREMEKQLTALKRREQALLAGVDARFVRFVLSEVEEPADGEEFGDALARYLKENEQFLKPKAGWGQPQQTAKNTENGVERAFYALNPRLKH